jgi:hypothetical protein
MDEIRVSKVARSSDWISAQYLSMTDNFITFGNEVEVGETHGSAYIFFGYPGIASNNISAAYANVTIHGSDAGDQIGWSVSDAGDVNGDGYDDVIIGAPGYSNDKGRAYVFYGRATGSWSDIDDASTDADVILTGENDADQFGCSVSRAGDLNNDTDEDVIVGAYGYSYETGRAYIFEGGSWFNGSISADNANVTLTGTSSNDRFGWAVSDAGNADNDIYDDVIVGAPGADKAYIFLGDDSISSSISASNANAILSGDANTDFGYSVASCGNINSAGGDDVIVGAPGYRYSKGRAYIFYGKVYKNEYNDIVTADFSDDTVTILNGTSSGGWEAKTTLDVGQLPYHAFVGDANNDGYNDIVTADFLDDIVTIYNGTSSGGWETKSTLSVGDGPNSVFVGDANNDGYNDILTTDGADDTITIYNGTSSGGWEAKYTLGTGSSPMSVFVGDANNDGYNDILAADWIGNTVTIYNGTSSGWEASCTLSVGTDPISVFVGDANNDGYNDILTADQGANTVTIYNGTSSGGWEAKYTLAVGNTPNSVFVGDANNDGYNDILAADRNAATVTIYNGTSSGGWEAKGILDVGTGPFDVFVGDANNDGYNDILTANNPVDTVTILNGTSSGDWEAKFSLGVGNAPYSVFVANVNNDYGAESIDASDADLILTGEAIGHKFGYSVHYAGDIDGDGEPDVIVGAPYYSNNTKTECGAFYVYNGGSDIDEKPDYANYGENDYDHFGWSVSYAGDMNGDSVNETLCGAPHFDDGAETDAGKAYCHSTFIISEFDEISIPIIFMLILVAVWRRKWIQIKKRHEYERFPEKNATKQDIEITKEKS